MLKSNYGVVSFGLTGYFASTAGKHGDESMIRKYVKNQGNNYEQLHCDHQLAMC
jgi:putative transposase